MASWSRAEVCFQGLQDVVRFDSSPILVGTIQQQDLSLPLVHRYRGRLVVLVMVVVVTVATSTAEGVGGAAEGHGEVIIETCHAGTDDMSSSSSLMVANHSARTMNLPQSP
jgi:hypothetical protein